MGMRAVFVAAILFAATPEIQSGNFRWKWRDWQELTYKQALRVTRIPEAQRASIAAALIQQISSANPGAYTTQQLEERVLSTAVRLVDLNRDGKPDVIAQGPPEDCSPTGNCPFYVFQSVGGGFRLIGKSFGQTFTLQGRTNGYVDIVVSMHGSAMQSDLHLLRYTGGGYREVACYSAQLGYITDSGYQKLKEPELTPCRQP
jgi:hypothetical protein